MLKRVIVFTNKTTVEFDTACLIQVKKIQTQSNLLSEDTRKIYYWHHGISHWPQGGPELSLVV